MPTAGRFRCWPRIAIYMVTETGTPLSKSARDSAWQRMIKRAIDQGVITKGQRFALHGLKHRGITDSDD